MKKKIFSTILVAAMVASMTACGTSENTNTTTPTASAGDTTTEDVSNEDVSTGDVSSEDTSSDASTANETTTDDTTSTIDDSNIVFQEDWVTVSVTPNGETENIAISWMDGENERIVEGELPSTMEFKSATNYETSDKVTSEGTYLVDFDSTFNILGDVCFYDATSEGGATIFYNLLTNVPSVSDLITEDATFTANLNNSETNTSNIDYGTMGAGFLKYLSEVGYVVGDERDLTTHYEAEGNCLRSYKSNLQYNNQTNSLLILSANVIGVGHPFAATSNGVASIPA